MARTFSVQLTLSRDEVCVLGLALEHAHGPVPMPMDLYPIAHGLRTRLRRVMAAAEKPPEDAAATPAPATAPNPDTAPADPDAALAAAVEAGDGHAARAAGRALVLAPDTT